MSGKEMVLDVGNKEVQNVGNTPADMIRMAVAGGADLDKLEKLLALQERWESNEARKSYHKAMAEFKANPPKIDKDREVAYGNTKYRHATLGNVTEKISSELSKYGLSATWHTQQNGQIVVTCRITHTFGHYEETSLSAPSDTSGSKNAIQAIGSTITYLERYTLLALTGLATYEQDDDGRGATPRITDQQLGTIRDALIAIGEENNESKLAKGLGFDSIEEIPSTEYKRAMAAIEARANAKALKGAK